MASSTPSLSRPDEQESLPSFDALVAHLLAAKRSLSCVEQVSHANDLVTATRLALEQQTILWAQTNFLADGCSMQIRSLTNIKSYLKRVYDSTGAEFSDVAENLARADAQLNKIVDQLRATFVEQSLRPTDEARKALIDFVDETGPRKLLETIESTIKSARQSREDYEQSIGSLDKDMAAIRKLLEVIFNTASPAVESNGLSFSLPDALRTMEDAAQDMADNLESLVKHFDLCATAIKHTEGGGAAATGLMADLPEGVGLSLNWIDSVPESISESEKKNMLEILQKDATEVEEVVNEVKERAAEIETYFDHVIERGEYFEDLSNQTNAALKLLDDVGQKLPSSIASCQMFLFRWEDEKARIEQYLLELSGLCEFYAGFLVAYDELIIEVGRRKDTDKRIRQIFQKALVEVDDILQDETIERDRFRQAQGEFLPVDIWPGLSAEPSQYDITSVDGKGNSTPDISASVINRAIRRAEQQKKSQNTAQL